MKFPVWQQHIDKNFWHVSLPDLDALYLQINRVVEEKSGDFRKFVANLPKPDSSGLSRLIIDLRTNRGGDATIIQPFIHSIIKHWNYLKLGNIFVLTSNNTFSAAVHLAAELEKNTHAMFIGEATAAPPNHYADVKAVKLPNSDFEVEISSLYWQKSGPRDTRKAIYPDKKIKISWIDHLKGFDPVLKTIKEIKSRDEMLKRNRNPLFNWFRKSQRKSNN